MPRFFIEMEENNKADEIIIRGEDSRHISKSLRMKEGDEIIVCDGHGFDYKCIISKVDDDVKLEIKQKIKCVQEPPYDATVYQALVKGDKFETVIQKSVECGASRIVPYISDYCVVRIKKEDCLKKLERWQKIAVEAAKQSGRGMIPKVEPLLSFNEMVNEASKTELPIIFYEKENEISVKDILKKAKTNSKISIIIGSEGGFSKEEIALAKSKNIISAGLGKRILRTETASAFALSCISYELEL